MRRAFVWVFAALVCAFALGPVQSQPRGAPKLEPVAETKLLMEGLAEPNARALGKMLNGKPAGAEAWAFARGQALLLAETGNLLLMRPPRARASQDAWMNHAADLRDSATALARAAAAKELAQARTALANVGNACNRCHRAFGTGPRVDPFGE
jgi:cytochrome c556